MYVLQTQEDVDAGQQPHHVNSVIHLDLNIERLGVSSRCQSLQSIGRQCHNESGPAQLRTEVEPLDERRSGHVEFRGVM